ncbi:precorrin-3B synthase [uncultured Alsobacter sp.]|uniref:precorrin-3B synthase n=1 Tax=uncultured Alsobacter sp. TaxID=1748258 RepID=UPI0025E0743C|nr:precorrin-3B synthase [uncultured Alsobacter sp.]
MSAPATDHLRKGWCPGALRPMETGDGLLVRLRLTGGILPAALALDLADAARRYGGGAFDLSARANLQIRGVTAETLPDLTERLSALGVLDDDAAGEAVRNVIASPLAGLDPAALLDIRPVVAALEHRLTTDTALHALPGKFGFAVEDGGAFPLGDLSVDLRFVAQPDGRFAILAGGRCEGPILGRCDAESVPETAAALARAFLALRGPHRRMEPLAKDAGLATIATAAGLGTPDGAVASPRPAASVPGNLHAGERPVLAVAATFGRWSSDAIAALAGLARDKGTGELRLTPWRCLLLPGVAMADAADTVAAHDLIVDPWDPRLSVAACAGAPACSSGEGPTRELALDLALEARLLAVSGTGLHVSGCPKGCAHPGASPVTIVARRGLYDLVIGGRAGDGTTREGLDRASVVAAVRSLAAEAARTPQERGRA